MDEATAQRIKEKLSQLKEKLTAQEEKHKADLDEFKTDYDNLKVFSDSLEECSPESSSHHFERRVVWTIEDYTKRSSQFEKSKSMWSPKFKAAGLTDVQLEFFPKGRDKKEGGAANDGFCSLFLWCTSAAHPRKTKMRYQLFVGSFMRTPDDEEFSGRIGHGHSDFCPVEPEIDKSKDTLKVGVDFLEVLSDAEVEAAGVKLTSLSIADLVAEELKVIRTSNVENVVWKIPKASSIMGDYPRGTSMVSKCFSAAGIREMYMEFYPNGIPSNKVDGTCAFYIRCPERISIIVTLFVGGVRKGPIATTFDNVTGKGLPDFCKLQEQINAADDTIDVGIQIQNQLNHTNNIVGE